MRTPVKCCARCLEHVSRQIKSALKLGPDLNTVSPDRRSTHAPRREKVCGERECNYRFPRATQVFGDWVAKKNKVKDSARQESKINTCHGDTVCSTTQHTSRAVHRCADVLVAYGKRLARTPGRICLFVITIATKRDPVANKCQHTEHCPLRLPLAPCGHHAPPKCRGGRPA